MPAVPLRALSVSLLLLTGCAGAEGGTPDLLVDDRPGSPEGEDKSEERDLADAYVRGPDALIVVAGDLLDVELQLLRPQEVSLLPGDLPEQAVWTGASDGGRLQWRPLDEDVGQYDFVFLIVDALDPAVVLAQKDISVDVLPRFSLIEYGF